MTPDERVLMEFQHQYRRDAARQHILAVLEQALHLIETPGDFTREEAVQVQADILDAIKAAKGEA